MGVVGYFIILAGSIAGWAGLIYLGPSALLVPALFALTFLVHGAFDWALQKLGPAPDFWYRHSTPAWVFRIPVYLCFPLQLLLVIEALKQGAASSLGGAITAGTLCGISGGIIGIAASHELVHSHNRLERLYGKAFLALINYPHFWLEHSRHHVTVATFQDVDTARRNESVFAFMLRSIPSGWVSCWGWERRQMAFITLFQAALCGGVALRFGALGLAVFVVQGLVTLLLLKWINYVEHYGLVRREIGGRLEPIRDSHSWDSTNAMTNWCLFNLGFHSQHHRTARAPYHSLPSAKSEWHTLPLGYANMMLIALFPPLFRKIMDPLLESLTNEAGSACGVFTNEAGSACGVHNARDA
jgi:alkane 1-monooxygenase